MNDISPPSNEPVVRPPAVDYLIADYGKHVGLDGLTFDDDQMIVLELDGVDLVIEYVDTDEGFVFQSVIELPSGSDSLAESFSPGEIHRTLNHLNAGSFRQGKGLVFLTPESSRIMWMDRLRLENLSVELFDLAIQNAIVNIRTWSDVIQTLQDSSATAEGAESFPEASTMIRI